MSAHENEICSVLRVINYRLSVTPHQDLPSTIQQVISCLHNCDHVFASAKNQTIQGSSLQTQLIRTFYAKISSLLTDKHYKSRWAAVVLIKASIESGGVGVLRDNITWVQGLISIIAGRNPQTTKKLSVIVLSRFYTLVQQDPLLMREAATPSFPSFINASLANLEQFINGKQSIQYARFPSLCATILESLAKLLPLYSSTIRSFRSRLTTLLKPLLASAPSNSFTSTQDYDNTRFSLTVSHQARRLFSLLSFSAAKTSLQNEWIHHFEATMKDCEQVSTVLFQHISEAWQSSPRLIQSTGSLERNIFKPSDSGLGLPAWSGTNAGFERLSGLLETLKSFIASPTAAAVAVPLSDLIFLLVRVLQISTSPNNMRIVSKNEISSRLKQDEPDHLPHQLDTISEQAVSLMQVCLLRFEGVLKPFHRHFLTQLIWRSKQIMRSTPKKPTIARKRVELSCFEILARSCSGASDLNLGQELLPIIQAICAQLISVGNHGQSNISEIPDEFVTSESTHKDRHDMHHPPHDSLCISEGRKPRIEAIAQQLLTSLSCSIHPDSMGSILRSSIERTAILLRLPDAMLGTILNPSQSSRLTMAQSSILPILTRLYPMNMETESVIRPRMPVWLTTGSTKDIDSEDAELAGVPDYSSLFGNRSVDNVDTSLVENQSRNAIDNVNELGLYSSNKSTVTPVLQESGNPPSATQPLAVKCPDQDLAADEISPVKANTSLLPSHAEETISHVSRKRSTSTDPASGSWSKRRHTTSKFSDQSGSQSDASSTRPVGFGLREPEIVEGLREEVDNDGEEDFEIPELNIDPDTDED